MFSKLNFQGGYMNKADKFKLLYVLGISLIFFFAGCVDTSVNNLPTTVNYRSQVNVVNLAAGMGSAHVIMHEASGATAAAGQTIDFGSINLGNTSPSDGSFQDIPAGSKTVMIAYSGSSAKDTLKLSTISNYKLRLFLVGTSSAGSRSFVTMNQRYIASTKEDTILFPKTEAQVAFVNGSPDDTVSTVGMVAGSDTTEVSLADLVMGDASSYSQFTPKTYNIYVTSSTGAVAQQSVALKAQGRYTVIIYDNASNLKLKVLTDD